MASMSELKRIYFYNDCALIVDKSVKEYCYVKDQLSILKVKDMIGFFICHEDLKEKESQLKSQDYKKVNSMIDRYPKLWNVGVWSIDRLWKLVKLMNEKFSEINFLRTELLEYSVWQLVDKKGIMVVHFEGNTAEIHSVVNSNE